MQQQQRDQIWINSRNNGSTVHAPCISVYVKDHIVHTQDASVRSELIFVMPRKLMFNYTHIVVGLCLSKLMQFHDEFSLQSIYSLYIVFLRITAGCRVISSHIEVSKF